MGDHQLEQRTDHDSPAPAEAEQDDQWVLDLMTFLDTVIGEENAALLVHYDRLCDGMCGAVVTVRGLVGMNLCNACRDLPRFRDVPDERHRASLRLDARAMRLMTIGTALHTQGTHPAARTLAVSLLQLEALPYTSDPRFKAEWLIDTLHNRAARAPGMSNSASSLGMPVGAAEPKPAPPAEEMFWIGELSGWTVELLGDGYMEVRHRCGYSDSLAGPGWGIPTYLGNLIEEGVKPHNTEGCHE